MKKVLSIVIVLAAFCLILAGCDALASGSSSSISMFCECGTSGICICGADCQCECEICHPVTDPEPTECKCEAEACTCDENCKCVCEICHPVTDPEPVECKCEAEACNCDENCKCECETCHPVIVPVCKCEAEACICGENCECECETCHPDPEPGIDYTIKFEWSHDGLELIASEGELTLSKQNGDTVKLSGPNGALSYAWIIDGDYTHPVSSGQIFIFDSKDYPPKTYNVALRANGVGGDFIIITVEE